MRRKGPRDTSLTAAGPWDTNEQGRAAEEAVSDQRHQCVPEVVEAKGQSQLVPWATGDREAARAAGGLVACALRGNGSCDESTWPQSWLPRLPAGSLQGRLPSRTQSGLCTCAYTTPWAPPFPRSGCTQQVVATCLCLVTHSPSQAHRS